jgi:hypothetical protein
MNAYPNPENYLQPSFGTPQEAPSVDPDEGVLISVAYNPAWTKLLLGAVTQMRQYAAWAADHDTMIETVERVNSLMFQLQNDISSVPAPFWDEDSADDSDDTAPVDDQPWYGQIVLIDGNLTFVENAFIYVVAGFIAYAGLPTAAVSFIPIARNFVVTMKSNPLGGIVRFLADAVEIGRVDTYAAADGIVSAPITMPAPAMGFVAEDVSFPTLWVELLDDNPHELPSVSMTLIRSRLSEADFSSPSLRYNADTDQMEFTPDGGATWNPAPGSDPRHSTAFLRPPVAGSSKRCDAAANMTQWLRDFIDRVLAAFEGVVTVTTITNAILQSLAVITEGFTELLAIIIDVAETISGIGATALALAFTDDQYDLLTCIFFCHADFNGRISVAALASIESDVTAQLNTTAALVVNSILFVQGEIGLSNAGAIGSETGDCDACACQWCYHFDAADQLADWSSEEWSAGTPIATWDGTSWNSGCFTTGHQVAYIHLRWVLDAPIHLTDAAITEWENSNTGSGQGIWVNGDGSIFSGTQVWAAGGSYTGGEIEVTSIDMLLFVIDGGCPDITIMSAQFSGSDDVNPFGDNNC